ncbi:hypothetical protein SDRG_06758 [Saprolegnia diclina VS20]|uniref:Uncharacterized protein n=1 Tax=Saprolegnia diclina (strain VS20) TaxID=1156394 RepID=T0QQ90_SAPDV|nr:hypothetical protein SDRG_06758 [Saprolegnia diclina VS20]EQC36020.1 hypothetical protein SDRG_06758 [Saprolegnia diclina VS20]|eukprot:XP_008610782.1 hypothetical protein SDRG_06758 [Saprolegnia diclina VS20]
MMMHRQAVRAFSTRGAAPRVFPQFSSYGSDALFQVAPLAAVYTHTGKYLKLKRGGSLMLSWCKATQQGYNYQDKLLFSVSPREIGAILNTLDSKQKITLVHSPNMNDPQANEGLRKSFSIEYQPEHHKTVFAFSSDQARTAVALDAGETRVLKELLQYSVPYLYGFHAVLEAEPTIEYEGGAMSASSGPSAPRANRGPPTAGEWPF